MDAELGTTLVWQHPSQDIGANFVGALSAVTLQPDGVAIYDNLRQKLLRKQSLGNGFHFQTPAVLDVRANTLHAVVSPAAGGEAQLISWAYNTAGKRQPSTILDAGRRSVLPSPAHSIHVLSSGSASCAAVVLQDGRVTVELPDSSTPLLLPSPLSPSPQRLRGAASSSFTLALLMQGSTSSPASLHIYQLQPSQHGPDLRPVQQLAVPCPPDSAPCRASHITLHPTCCLVMWSSGAVTIIHHPSSSSSSSSSSSGGVVHAGAVCSTVHVTPPPSLLAPGTPPGPDHAPATALPASARKRKVSPGNREGTEDESSQGAPAPLLATALDDTQVLLARLLPQGQGASPLAASSTSSLLSPAPTRQQGGHILAAQSHSAGSSGTALGVPSLQYVLVDSRYGCVMSEGCVELEGLPIPTTPLSAQLLAPPFTSPTAASTAGPQLAVQQQAGPTQTLLLLAVGGSGVLLQVSAQRASLAALVGRLALGQPQLQPLAHTSSSTIPGRGKPGASPKQATAGVAPGPRGQAGDQPGVEGPVVFHLDLAAVEAATAAALHAEQGGAAENTGTPLLPAPSVAGKGGPGAGVGAADRLALQLSSKQSSSNSLVVGADAAALAAAPCRGQGQGLQLLGLPPLIHQAGSEEDADSLAAAAQLCSALTAAAITASPADVTLLLQAAALLTAAYEQLQQQQQQAQLQPLYQQQQQHKRKQRTAGKQTGAAASIHAGRSESAAAVGAVRGLSVLTLPPSLLPLTVQELAAQSQWPALASLLRSLPLHSLTGCPDLLPLLAQQQQYGLLPLACCRLGEVAPEALVACLQALLSPTTASNRAARREYAAQLRASAEQALAAAEEQLAVKAPAPAPLPPSCREQARAVPGHWPAPGSALDPDAHAAARSAMLSLARCAAAAVDGWSHQELLLHAPLALHVDVPGLQACLPQLTRSQVDRLLAYLASWLDRYHTRLGDLSLNTQLPLPQDLLFPTLQQVLDLVKVTIDSHLPHLLMATKLPASLTRMAVATKQHVDGCKALLPLQGATEHIRSGAPLPAGHVAAATLYTVQYLDLGVRAAP
ncbi:hypothetical protein V8C86DRAFT_2482210 [Haematococcus lacustris]